MNDAGCSCADHFEENGISHPQWQRGLLIETSLRKELYIAKTPLMQLNENIIRNCYDCLPPKQYVTYSASRNVTILSKISFVSF